MLKKYLISRRQFLVGGFWSLVGLGFLGYTGKVLTQFLLPRTRVHYEDVLAGEVTEIPVGFSKSIRNLAGYSVVLINQKGVIRAFSASCTHLGCVVQWQKDKKIFYCPCHQGHFDPNGKAIAGPPKLPLPEFETKVVAKNIFVRIKKKSTGIQL